MQPLERSGPAPRNQKELVRALINFASAAVIVAYHLVRGSFGTISLVVIGIIVALGCFRLYKYFQPGEGS